MTIDPYGLWPDSTDVTFAVLAWRVESVLERRNSGAAVMMGHAHGGGVALRGAAAAHPHPRLRRHRPTPTWERPRTPRES